MGGHENTTPLLIDI